jgi:hypothetical protein
VDFRPCPIGPEISGRTQVVERTIGYDPRNSSTSVVENLPDLVNEACNPLPNQSTQEANSEIRINGDSEESSGRGIQRGNQQVPQFRLQKAIWGNPLRIELRKESSNEQGQSFPTENQAESSFTNDIG